MIFKNSSDKMYSADIMALNGYSQITGYNINVAQVFTFHSPNLRGFKTYTMIMAVKQTDQITGIDVGFTTRTLSANIPSYFKLKGLTNLDFTNNIYPSNPAGYKEFAISFGGNALDYTGYVLDNVELWINNVKGDNFTLMKLLLLCYR
jgi:hypothetical protein